MKTKLHFQIDLYLAANSMRGFFILSLKTHLYCGFELTNASGHLPLCSIVPRVLGGSFSALQQLDLSQEDKF